MSIDLEPLVSQGWILVNSAYSSQRLREFQSAVGRLTKNRTEAVREQSGSVYAARNVLEIVPEVTRLWRSPALIELVLRVLGERAGLVRALFFDKPPEQTWALPWHKDLLIAVNDGTCEKTGYTKPRPRAGVLHTEPPVEVLKSMLTLRIHLDPMTKENGPLEVLSGSHQTGKQLQVNNFPREVITSDAGAVFVMRPLLAHASGRSISNASQHRRVLHFEFSGMPELPEKVHWHTFFPINRVRECKTQSNALD